MLVSTGSDGIRELFLVGVMPLLEMICHASVVVLTVGVEPPMILGRLVLVYSTPVQE